MKKVLTVIAIVIVLYITAILTTIKVSDLYSKSRDRDILRSMVIYGYWEPVNLVERLATYNKADDYCFRVRESGYEGHVGILEGEMLEPEEGKRLFVYRYTCIGREARFLKWSEKEE